MATSYGGLNENFLSPLLESPMGDYAKIFKVPKECGPAPKQSPPLYNGRTNECHARINYTLRHYARIGHSRPISTHAHVRNIERTH